MHLLGTKRELKKLVMRKDDDRRRDLVNKAREKILDRSSKDNKSIGVSSVSVERLLKRSSLVPTKVCPTSCTI
jgi:hypothetical protein